MQVLHATTVAVAGQGLLILGPSGSGKSGLALRLMALGAVLVADDRTIITARDGALWASCPATIAGRIEARGLGILRADPSPPVALALAVDLSRTETDRLPPWHELRLDDGVIPLVYRAEASHFEAGLIQYLKAGRAD